MLFIVFTIVSMSNDMWHGEHNDQQKYNMITKPFKSHIL